LAGTRRTGEVQPKWAKGVKGRECGSVCHHHRGLATGARKPGKQHTAPGPPSAIKLNPASPRPRPAQACPRTRKWLRPGAQGAPSTAIGDRIVQTSAPVGGTGAHPQHLLWQTPRLPSGAEGGPQIGNIDPVTNTSDIATEAHLACYPPGLCAANRQVLGHRKQPQRHNARLWRIRGGEGLRTQGVSEEDSDGTHEGLGAERWGKRSGTREKEAQRWQETRRQQGGREGGKKGDKAKESNGGRGGLLSQGGGR